MKVAFDGIGENMVTFEANGVKAGDLVKVSAQGTVAPCAASGDVPSGVTVGFGLFACGADGKLAKGTSGRPGFVLDVDSAAGVCGILF